MHGLIIAPFVIVEEFYLPLFLLSKVLKELNHNITMVHCRQSMKSNCTAFLAKGISVTEQSENSNECKKICDLCLKSSKLASKINPWNTEWLYPETVQPNKVTNERLWKFAGYEIVISQKVDLKNIKGKIFEAWLERYKTLVSLENQISLITKKNKYDYAICYNSLYGIHQLFLEKCKKEKIPFLSLHSSLHMKKEDEYILYKNNVLSLLKNIKRNFRFQNQKILRKDKINISNHINATIDGNKPWAYSTPPENHDIKAEKNQKAKKILVLLSSPDELTGFQLLGLSPKKEKHVFQNQIVWIKWIYILAKKHPTWTFFIRPHPRIFPNKRELIQSPFGKKLKNIKKIKKPKNIIWPSQKKQGSLWDHLGNTQLVFNAWSSASEIFQTFGVPVITFFPEFSNSGKLVDETAFNKIEFERKAFAFLSGKKRLNKNKIWWWLKCMLDCNSFLLSSDESFFGKFMKMFVPSKILKNHQSLVYRFKTPKIDPKHFKRIFYNLISGPPKYI